MKRTLIVTLVASALELYAATVSAQVAGQCSLVGNATSVNGSTAAVVGPLNPIDGFPEYLTDSTGLSIQRCLDPAVCFFAPVIATDPFSIQIGSGNEAFYWGADAKLADAAGKTVATVVMAAESAFLQFGPNGEPINGSQFPFLRLRFTIGVPVDGTYTVQHPYGTDVFTVVGATGARDIFATVDRGLTPGATVQGPVGPWLKWDPAFAAAPAGFLGNGGTAGVANRVVGSPCGRNSVTLAGVDTRGRPVSFGAGLTQLTTNLFNVQGKIFDGKTQTPLNPTRLTYSRSIAGAGQIDNFAASTATASVSVIDGPTISVGSSRIPQSQTLDHLALSTTTGINSFSVPVLDASALPSIIAMTAVDPSAVDPVTLAAKPTDPTTLNLHLVDFVDIAAADYDPSTGNLSVSATSSDLRTAPALTLRDFGTFSAGSATKVVSTIAPPGVVTVDSAAGGSATALVRLTTAAAPAAPSGLVLAGATSTSLSLRWVDTATNETGFNVYSVAADGSRTLVASTPANTTSVVISGLSPATTTTYQVDAFNTAGPAASNTLVATTLALPATPAAPSAILGASRSVVIGWTDTSDDETGFQIERASALAGPYSVVATAAANTTSATDTTATQALTFFYRVVTQRGADLSLPSASVSLTTPAFATSPTAPTGVAASSGTQVAVSWGDRSTNETGFQVYRRIGTGTFSAVSGVLPANTTTYTDTTTTPGTSYNYRVDVSNWAGVVQSGISAAITTPVPVTVSLSAPAGLAISAARPPVLSWTDTATGETAYRVRRSTVTMNANGSISQSAATTLSSTLAAGTSSYSDLTATASAVYLYDVAAMNGATVGALASGYTVAATGGLTAPSGVTLTRALVGTAAQVTVRWTLATPNTAVGGFEIQRCVGATCTTFAKVSGSAVNTAGTVDGRATLSFVNTGLARATTYSYRVRSVGGGNTGLTSAFTARSTVTTQ